MLGRLGIRPREFEYGANNRKTSAAIKWDIKYEMYMLVFGILIN